MRSLPRAVSVFFPPQKHQEEHTKAAKYGIGFHCYMHKLEKVMLLTRLNRRECHIYTSMKSFPT